MDNKRHYFSFHNNGIEYVLPHPVYPYNGLFTTYITVLLYQHSIFYNSDNIPVANHTYWCFKEY